MKALSLDAGLLEPIDEAEESPRPTRSAFISGAAREKIRWECWYHVRRSLRLLHRRRWTGFPRSTTYESRTHCTAHPISRGSHVRWPARLSVPSRGCLSSPVAPALSVAEIGKLRVVHAQIGNLMPCCNFASAG